MSLRRSCFNDRLGRLRQNRLKIVSSLPMTKAIIFDLDSCLAAADEVGQNLFAPAFAAIRATKTWRC
jgi:hypothetical protein